MDAIGAGLLSAFGNFGLGLGGAMDQQRKDALDREKLEQDRSLRQQVIDAQAAQFQQTQAAAERDKYFQPNDLAALFQQIGIPVPETMMGPSAARVPTAWGPELLKEAAARQTRQQEQGLRGQQANVLERLGAGTPAGPAQLAGQLAEGEDPEAAALIPRVPGAPATPANARYQAIAGLLRQGPLSEYLVKALDAETDKAQLVSDTTRGYLKGGVYTPLPVEDRPGAGAMPEARPGFEIVTAYDKNGRPSYTEQRISVGTDREGLAMDRGYTSFAQAPESVRKEINQYLDTQSLRRQQQQGVDAARLNAKPLTEEEAKGFGASTTTLGAVTQIQKFSADEIGRYVGLLNRPAAETQQMLAGMGLGTADKRFIDFKTAVGRLQATMFDTAGKAVTESEKKVVTSFIPTGDEPNAETFMQKVRSFDAYTRAARDLRLDLSRTGRGQIDPTDYDARLQAAMGGAGMNVQTGPHPSWTAAPTVAGPNRLSRQDPLYSHARGRGMTDQQIQSKYGITLVP